jgi:hypothetical protein
MKNEGWEAQTPWAHVVPRGDDQTMKETMNRCQGDLGAQNQKIKGRPRKSAPGKGSAPFGKLAQKC